MNWRKIVGLAGPYSNSTGIGPDFPGSAGDRERSKFRPSVYPRLTMVAVSDDAGNPVDQGSQAALEENTLYLKAIVLGLSIITETDLLDEVSG